MLPHPSRQRHALAVGYENCCLEFCCGLVSEPMLPPSRLSAPLLGPPSPRGLSSHHQSHGPLSSFPGGLLLRPPYRYGLHAAQTSFLRPGPVATFRLVCRACSPSPRVVKIQYQLVKNRSRIKFPIGKILRYKKTAGTKQHRRSRPIGHKKAPHGEGRGENYGQYQKC